MTEVDLQSIGNRMLNMALHLRDPNAVGRDIRELFIKQLEQDGKAVLSLAPFTINVGPPK